MNIWLITEDKSVYHHVIASDKLEAIKMVFACCDEAIESELDAQVESLYKVLAIKVDGFRKTLTIRHTCEEWLGIYDHKPQYLCCSEW